MSVTKLASLSFAGCPGEADRADDQTETALPGGKDVLDCDLDAARPALPRPMCGGSGLPQGFGFWNCGASLCRVSRATFATERYGDRGPRPRQITLGAMQGGLEFEYARSTVFFNLRGVRGDGRSQRLGIGRAARRRLARDRAPTTSTTTRSESRSSAFLNSC
jgi:hypothetical protein